MARIEPSALPERRRRARLPRLAGSLLDPARLAAVVVASIGVAEVPETWVRALAALALLLVAYRAGSDDGRRDLALELLGGRNLRRPGRAAPTDAVRDEDAG